MAAAQRDQLLSLTMVCIPGTCHARRHRQVCAYVRFRFVSQALDVKSAQASESAGRPCTQGVYARVLPGHCQLRQHY